MRQVNSQGSALPPLISCQGLDPSLFFTVIRHRMKQEIGLVGWVRPLLYHLPGDLEQLLLSFVTMGMIIVLTS